TSSRARRSSWSITRPRNATSRRSASASGNSSRSLAARLTISAKRHNTGSATPRARSRAAKVDPSPPIGGSNPNGPSPGDDAASLNAKVASGSKSRRISQAVHAPSTLSSDRAVDLTGPGESTRDVQPRFQASQTGARRATGSGADRKLRGATSAGKNHNLENHRHATSGRPRRYSRESAASDLDTRRPARW